MRLWPRFKNFKLNFLVIWKIFLTLVLKKSRHLSPLTSITMLQQMVYFHCERVFSKFLSHFVKLQVWNVCLRLGMHQTTHDCFQIIACSDNFPPSVIEILMKYSLFFLRVFANNLRNITYLLWTCACEIIHDFIFLNYFDTGTISVKEWSLNVIISVFSSKQHFPIS